LLILDEVGVQFGSETEKQILFSLLNGRYKAMLPTLLISNLTRDELAVCIGTRNLDRLQEGAGTFISFDWDSYRPKVHLDTDLPKQTLKPVQWDK
jgi:DNA replication protein DnaC